MKKHSFSSSLKHIANENIFKAAKTGKKKKRKSTLKKRWCWVEKPSGNSAFFLTAVFLSHFQHWDFAGDELSPGNPKPHPQASRYTTTLAVWLFFLSFTQPPAPQVTDLCMLCMCDLGLSCFPPEGNQMLTVAINPPTKQQNLGYCI